MFRLNFEDVFALICYWRIVVVCLHACAVAGLHACMQSNKGKINTEYHLRRQISGSHLIFQTLDGFKYDYYSI